MKKGKHSAETCKLNGWKVGDILEGEEWGRINRIKITAIGEQNILAKWENDTVEEDCCTTLHCREWRKIDEQ